MADKKKNGAVTVGLEDILADIWPEGDKPPATAKQAKPRRDDTPFKLVMAMGVACAAAALVFFIFFARWALIEAESRAAYRRLAEIAANVNAEETEDGGETGADGLTAAMSAINSDYMCWIYIEDTKVNYPVALGADNEKYIDTTFEGGQNALGAIFMDYRCGVNAPHLIIYGHNAKNRTMFGGLREYLSPEYLNRHKTITLLNSGYRLDYTVFAARRTDIYDPAYQLSFSGKDGLARFLEDIGAPKNAAQILTLSTCVSGDNEDERVIVQAALIPSK